MIRIRFGQSFAIVAFVFLVWPLSLFAEAGFYKGRHFFDFKYYATAGVAGDVATDLNNLYQPDLPILNLLGGSAEERNLAFWTRVDAPQPEMRGVGGAIDYSYALNDWFAIGASIAHSSYKVTELRPLQVFGGDVFSQALLSSTLNSSAYGPLFRQLEIFSPVVRSDSDAFIQIWSASFLFGFHFNKRGRFDPYLHFAVGAGMETMLDLPVATGAVMLGARYHIGKRFHLVVEGGYRYYYISGKSDETQQETVTGNIGETFVSAGAGFSI